MTWVGPFAALACVIADAAAGVRWLRVAQREHYLAGRVLLFAARWWSGPLHLVSLAAALAGSLLAWRLPVLAFIPAVVVGLGPLGLSTRGRTSKLRWTRRLTTVAAMTGAIEFLAVGLALVAGGWHVGLSVFAVLVIAVPVVIDLALALLEPVEARVGDRYVTRAHALVRRIQPRIVGITGSYGKTTTKRYLAHLLEGAFTVVASPRSFNNRSGLARTVNEHLVPGTDVLVAEMGAYGPGEIAAICAWLPPDVSVITAIGPVHLERFRTLERTLRAKAEIAAPASTVVLNVDDPRLAALAAELESGGKRVIRAGSMSPDAEVRVVVVPSGYEVLLAGERRTIVATGPTANAPTNVACALGAALALGAGSEELLARLVSLPGVENRLEVVRGAAGALIIDDTFNANPAGARLALGLLAAEKAGGRCVVVTPGMVELGPLQRAENAAFAADAARIATDLVIVGRTNRVALLEGAEATGPLEEGPQTLLHAVGNREAALAWIRANLGANDLVLFENDLPDHFP